MDQQRIRRLMRLMRLMPICQKPDTSKPAKGHRPTPICWAGTGGAANPSLVRRHHLPAHAQRLPLSGRHHGLVHPQSASLAHLEYAGGGLCIEALKEAIHKLGPPEI